MNKKIIDHHGYFFVPLPEKPDKLSVTAHTHFAKEKLSGRLVCNMKALTDLRVGSGILQLADDAGFAYIQDETEKVVNGIIRDADGNPVIPGSSLKGAFRSIAEAVTKSCMRNFDKSMREKNSKLPEEYKFPKKIRG